MLTEVDGRSPGRTESSRKFMESLPVAGKVNEVDGSYPRKWKLQGSSRKITRW